VLRIWHYNKRRPHLQKHGIVNVCPQSSCLVGKCQPIHSKFIQISRHISDLINQSIKEMEKGRSPLSHLHKFLQNGIKLAECVIGSDKFTFFVSGRRFVTNVLESVFMSRAIEDVLTIDFGAREIAVEYRLINKYMLRPYALRCRVFPVAISHHNVQPSES
jgi:hypothetical protein